MAEFSQPWDGTVLGDATRAPYSDDEWDSMYAGMFASGGDHGVLMGYDQGLEVSDAGGGSINVGRGTALVMGKFYKNNSQKQLDFAANGVHLVVLRCCWGIVGDCGAPTFSGSGETSGPRKVRLCVKENTVVLTQTDGVCYEIPLATVTRAGGAITVIVDMRHPIAPFSTFDFVPPLVGRNMTDASIIYVEPTATVPGSYWEPGILMKQNKSCRAWGRYIARQDLTDLRVAAIFISPSAVGTIFCIHYCFYTTCGGSHIEHVAGSVGTEHVIPAEDHIYCFDTNYGPAIAPEAGDVMKLFSERRSGGGYPEDTLAGDVVFIGWIMYARTYD